MAPEIVAINYRAAVTPTSISRSRHMHRLWVLCLRVVGVEPSQPFCTLGFLDGFAHMLDHFPREFLEDAWGDFDGAKGLTLRLNARPELADVFEAPVGTVWVDCDLVGHVAGHIDNVDLIANLDMDCLQWVVISRVRGLMLLGRVRQRFHCGALPLH